MGFHPFAISIAKIQQCRGEVGNNEKWRDGWDVVLSEGKESILWGETMWCVAGVIIVGMVNAGYGIGRRMFQRLTDGHLYN